MESEINRFLRIREITEEIVSPLETEDFVVQPIEDVSPPKWHLAHTTWFFENFILVKFLTNYQLFDDQFAYLFNSYYESQGDRILRNTRGSLSRPTTARIFEYRKHVDKAMKLLFEKQHLMHEELLTFFEIGLNHEQQHQELLITDIKYILGSNPLLPVYHKTKTATLTAPLELNWLGVEAGVYEIGHSGKDFSFDNELGRHKVYLTDFECMDRLVSNEEYLEFMQDGGYSNPALWLSEGWSWVEENKAEAPFYWYKKEDEWWNYTLHGAEKLNANAPVIHVNFYEAEAFARWKGMRLLTEFEWEIAARRYGQNENAQFQDTQLYQPKYNQGSNQFFGTAWEWTNSAYLPYPNYVQEAGALGEYNGKFMINQMVLRGGSCATPKDHFRISYRNFFHAHLQWQFTGIRLARNKK